MTTSVFAILMGTVLQLLVSHRFPGAFRKKLMVPALIVLCAMLAADFDCLWLCMNMLGGTIVGACIYWISLSFFKQ